MPSYSPVFSVPFILWGGGAGSLEFLVPAGYTAVVRDFSLDATVSAASATLQIQNSDEAPAVVVARVFGEGFPLYEQWTGRAVAVDGATISASVVDLGSDVSIYAGGYLLRNTLS